MNKISKKVFLKNIISKRYRNKIKKAYLLIKNLLYKIDNATFKYAIKKTFFNAHGYRLNLKNPESFNEKIVWKAFYDRNPLLPITIDKYLGRKYIEEKIGISEAKKYLIPLLYVTEKPEKIPFSELKEEYIIKPNHGSNWYIIAENQKNEKRFIIKNGKEFYSLANNLASVNEIIKICKKWLNNTYGRKMNEWAYAQIKPLIIIEKLLRDSSGNIPNDYKFLMFHGKCKAISTYTDRFSNLAITFYNEKWDLLNVARDKPTKPIEKPEELDKMISYAEKLSQDFDFVRIDLYLVDDLIYIGEITQYPSAGLAKIKPVEFDFELGSYWKIK